MTARKTVAAALLVAALALTGCGRSNTSSGGGEQAKGIAAGPAKGAITVWAMGTEGEQLGKFAKTFEQANPGATVKVSAVPWNNAHDKLATAIAGRTTPDVSLVGTTWMAEFAKTGALDPTPTAIDKSAFYEGPWSATVVNGTSYGVPWYADTRVLYYRKDMAAKAGVQPPTTWDQLKSFAAALQRKGGAKYGIYLQPGQTGSWQTMMPFAWQAGAQLTSDGKYTLDTPQLIKGLAYYQSFFKEGLASKINEQAIEPLFISGKYGAFISGPWEIGLLGQQGGAAFKDKWAVTTLPKGDVNNDSFVGGGDLAVFKDTKQRDTAWKFVQWLSQPDTQSKWFTTVGDLPSVRAAFDSPALRKDPAFAAFQQQLGAAQSPPAVPTWEQVAAAIDGEIEKVAKSGESPATAAKAMQAKATAIGTGF
jgi:multiple sugar transport system substrate-binding protein